MKDSKVTLNVKCSTCIHYQTAPLHNKVCAELGVTKNAMAPNCYSPDPAYMARSIPIQIIKDLGKHLRELDVTELQTLSFYIRNASMLQQKSTFKFGQPVYVCLGNQYLSHYFSGYVLGMAYTGEHILVTSSLTQDEDVTVLTLLPESILTRSQFNERKMKLIKAKRLEERKGDARKYRLPIAVAIAKGEFEYSPTEEYVSDYEPPSIDQAPNEMQNKQADISKHKRTLESRTRTPRKKQTVNLEDVGNMIVDEDGSTTFSMED